MMRKKIIPDTTLIFNCSLTSQNYFNLLTYYFATLLQRHTLIQSYSYYYKCFFHSQIPEQFAHSIYINAIQTAH